MCAPWRSLFTGLSGQPSRLEKCRQDYNVDLLSRENEYPPHEHRSSLSLLDTWETSWN
jgi:hypothetical protein